MRIGSIVYQVRLWYTWRQVLRTVFCIFGRIGSMDIPLVLSASAAGLLYQSI